MAAILKRPGVKRGVVVLVLMVVIVAVVWALIPEAAEPVSGAEAITVPVLRGDLNESITGSGSVTAAERKEVNSESTGTISALYVSEGQFVEKGDLLMTLNSASNDVSIRQSELNLQLAQKTLNDLYDRKDKLYIYAPAAGQISGTLPSVDQSVKNGSTFATITDQGSFQIAAEFTLHENQPIEIGQTVELFIQEYFQSIYGKVSNVSSSAISNSSNRRYQVMVQVENPGLLTTEDTFTMTLVNQYGRFSPASCSGLNYADPTAVEYQTDGTIVSLYVSDQEWVTQGQLLAVMKSSSLDDEINTQAIKVEQNRLDVEKLYDDLDSRTLYAPIAGTVVSLGVTEGEEVTDRSSALVTLAYLEAMTVVISVDELDILSVQTGMEAVVTSDAIPGKSFSAYVSEIALEGSSSSGVATFEVTLQIDEPGQLRSGMTVNTEIITTNRENVLLVPLAALTQEGPNHYVTLANADGSEGERRLVKVGAVNSVMAEIIEGLEEGQHIIYQEYHGTFNSNNAEMRTNMVMIGNGGATMSRGIPSSGGTGGPGGGVRP